MITVKVDTSRPYDVTVGAGVIGGLRGFMEERFPGRRKIALVTDSTVGALYSEKALGMLARAEAETHRFVFPAGEKSKNLSVYADLLAFLAGRRFSRDDAVVALGGGVTGDLAGFAAATYMRGMEFVQLPTSLLAMVDSSVGGKTAVNLEAGKNLVGAFHQPCAVFCDTDFLATLPEERRVDGMGEVFKYAVLGDAELFSALEKNPASVADVGMIARCVAMKRDIVNADEREKGKRKLLNLGHTFAHAIEKLSGYSVSHGRAVATGIVMASRAAERKGMLAAEDASRIGNLAAAMGFGIDCPYAPAEMAEVMLSDKKASRDVADFVLPAAIGKCAIVSSPVRDTAEMAGGGR